MANVMNVSMVKVRSLLQQCKNFVDKAVNGTNRISMSLSSLSEQVSGGKGEKVRATITSAQDILRNIKSNVTDLSGVIEVRYNQLEAIADDSAEASAIQSYIDEATAKYRDTKK